MIRKIISGGQTGVDRAALDLAIKLDIPHGGWIPKERLTENGPLATKYRLKETSTSNYSERTEKNVLEGDGTLIISRGPLSGGSEYTLVMAEKHQRPCLHIDLTQNTSFQAAFDINEWILKNGVEILNVAGPRASKDPQIYRDALKILESVYYLGLVENSIPPIGSTADPPRSDLTPTQAVPHTLEEAIDRLISKMPLKDKTTIANMSASELPHLHLTLGRYILNAFEMLSGNKELIESCREAAEEEFKQEEDAVPLIIKALWLKLRKTHKLRVIK